MVCQSISIWGLQAEGGAAVRALHASASDEYMERAREDDYMYHSSFEGESFGGDSPLV